MRKGEGEVGGKGQEKEMGNAMGAGGSGERGGGKEALGRGGEGSGACKECTWNSDSRCS